MAANGTWTATNSSGAPTNRSSLNGVWTGDRMLVWGGVVGSSTYSASGNAYDPVLNAWTSLSDTSAPTGRSDYSAVWTGKGMIVWGGLNSDSYSTTHLGGIYFPAKDGGVGRPEAGTP